MFGKCLLLQTNGPGPFRGVPGVLPVPQSFPLASNTSLWDVRVGWVSEPALQDFIKGTGHGMVGSQEEEDLQRAAALSLVLSPSLPSILWTALYPSCWCSEPDPVSEPSSLSLAKELHLL